MKETRAKKAFEDFTGHKATKRRVSRLDDRDVHGWEMGPVLGIAYEAKRDGKTQRYFHEFKKAARPRLVAKDDGSKLYIDGGRYKVTDRGIEDMPALFVVNPSPRRGKGKTKTRSKPMARRRRKSAVRRRATRQVAVFNTNPRRRRRRRMTYARNPAPRRRRRVMRSYRRNPIRRARRAGGLGVLNFGKLVLPAIGIGVGAVGAEIIMGYLPIPANFKTGVLRHVTKGAVAVTAGMIISKFLKQKKIGNAIALGGVVIAAHDALKEVITQRLPGVPFGQYLPRGAVGGGLGYYSPAGVVDYSAMGEYMPVVTGSLGETPDFHA
jgi:hypothetical protein